jgi:hypothetical protein
MSDHRDDTVTGIKKKHPFFGVILILIGVFALLINFNIISGLYWNAFWPILLIVIGILALYEHYWR